MSICRTCVHRCPYCRIAVPSPKIDDRSTTGKSRLQGTIRAGDIPNTRPIPLNIGSDLASDQRDPGHGHGTSLLRPYGIYPVDLDIRPADWSDAAVAMEVGDRNWLLKPEHDARRCRLEERLRTRAAGATCTERDIGKGGPPDGQCGQLNSGRGSLTEGWERRVGGHWNGRREPGRDDALGSASSIEERHRHGSTQLTWCWGCVGNCE